MDHTKAILHTSESLFLRYGIRSVSMDDIARELGMSKKTLYQCVENKSDLIGRIVESRIDGEKQDMARIVDESENAVEEMVRIGNYVIEKLRQFSPTIIYDLQKYYSEVWKKMESLHLSHVYQLIRDNIERGKQEGAYRKGVDADIVAKLYVAKTSLVVDEELFPTGQYDKEVLFRQYISYHLHGLIAEGSLDMLGRYMEKYYDESHKP